MCIRDSLDDISLIGKTINVDLISSSTIDQLRKNNINIKVPESDRPVSDATLKIYDQLNTEGVIKKRLNFSFFKYGDSRNPEEAGILGALLGSMFTLIITLLLSCLLYTSPSPRDRTRSRMPSSA